MILICLIPVRFTGAEEHSTWPQTKKVLLPNNKPLILNSVSDTPYNSDCDCTVNCNCEFTVKTMHKNVLKTRYHLIQSFDQLKIRAKTNDVTQPITICLKLIYILIIKPKWSRCWHPITNWSETLKQHITKNLRNWSVYFTFIGIPIERR